MSFCVCSFLSRRAVAVMMLGLSTMMLAQDAPAPSSNPDAKVVGADKPKTKGEQVDAAWALLQTALDDTKHVDVEIQALAALGTMGANPRSSKMIGSAFANKELDVRTAAVLAAGQAKDRALVPGLQKLLNDKEPQVAFTAASTLWKMGDRTGEDLLMAVVDGERKAGSGMVHGAMHSANRELHDPASLATFGAEQGASMLLGPFGFGITAYEYMKKNGGDTARSLAIEEIAQMKTPAVKKELMEALGDKDPGVRAAAAKGLRGYHDADVSAALAELMMDAKKPVQFAGAAAYLISVGVVALPPAVPLR